MKSLIITIALLVLCGASVSAQVSSKTGDDGRMFAPGVSLTGMQTAAGTFDDIDKKMWGNTFVLRGSGEWFSVHMTVTMDYTEGIPSFMDGNPIAFGTWSMVIYNGTDYYGTLYGEIERGVIHWVVDPKTGAVEKRNTDAMLRILGSVDGMQKFENYNIPMTFKADTLLMAKSAVTVAVLQADF